MEWIDSEAHGSLQTIREARVERVCSQEERACLMLSHEEESGRVSDEQRGRGRRWAPLSRLTDDQDERRANGRTDESEDTPLQGWAVHPKLE